jgi:small subunit ribosomal protein S17
MPRKASSGKKGGPKQRDIGIGVAPPQKECSDPCCPWHGRLPVRGRTFSGVVKSSKPSRTAIVEWGYHRFVRKYDRYERRTSRVVCHNPDCLDAREGDSVVIAECRPVSKTKSFVVVSVGKPASPAAGTKDKGAAE